MKNNFDLRTFLTENKLTSNSKINENQLPDDTKSLKASDAFRQVGIDMNEPVLVLTQDGGHGEQETKGTVSAREALKMFQQLRAKGMEDDKQDYYEFENELNFSAEGYEYKIAYFEEEATTTALMQKSGVSEKKVVEADRDEESMVHELIGDLFAPGNARSHLDLSVEEIARDLKRYSDDLTRQGVKDAMDLYDKLAADGTLDKEVEEGNGFVSSKHVPKLKKAFELIGLYGSEVSEIDADLLNRAQNTPAPKDAKRMTRPDKGLRVSMGKNAEQEQKVIDIAKAAIGLMDEQPGTSAEDALAAVLDI